ncbi:hypothetical protein OUZ56_020470 [Daphnia magna]|uniref:Uncharacterized protein n=1 Tax=Daphnia magna TaxID=35525 RepID=A0ABQ9ZEK1_9CRUS|nr:hypothetical protein OUZ56_020470 [Daphnia magna]
MKNRSAHVSNPTAILASRHTIPISSLPVQSSASLWSNCTRLFYFLGPGVTNRWTRVAHTPGGAMTIAFETFKDALDDSLGRP